MVANTFHHIVCRSSDLPWRPRLLAGLVVDLSIEDALVEQPLPLVAARVLEPQQRFRCDAHQEPRRLYTWDYIKVI